MKKNYVEDYYYEFGELRSGISLENDAVRSSFNLILPILIESKLTEKQRDVINFKFKNGMTQKEIAKKMGIAQPTVSRHFNTAIDILNENLLLIDAAAQIAIKFYKNGVLFDNNA